MGLPTTGGRKLSDIIAKVKREKAMTDTIASELIKKLDDLHAARKQMSYRSVYHGSYEAIAIEINKELKNLTGIDYIEHKHNQSRRDGKP